MKLAALCIALFATAVAPAPAAADAKGSGAGKPKGAKISVQIDGLDDLLDERMQDVMQAIGSNSDIPPIVRDKLTKRLERLRKKVRDRTTAGKLDSDALEALGDELGREMEAFGKEMDAWGKQFDKQMQQNLGKLGVRRDHDYDFHFNDGDDDDDDDDDDEDEDEDDDVVDDAMRGLGSLKLRPQQRDQIKKLRADSDAKVAAARRDLDRAADHLRKQLENPAISDAEVARAIDLVTQQEAAIRKARILAWVNARRLLDDAQRRKVEGAAKSKTK